MSLPSAVRLGVELIADRRVRLKSSSLVLAVLRWKMDGFSPDGVDSDNMRGSRPERSFSNLLTSLSVLLALNSDGIGCDQTWPKYHTHREFRKVSGDL